ncbi:hypothetical protein XI00_06745 [Bradyrhizobium sp. CCBAU 21359]|nr:hypothetical protein [Bradyrhizobium sp. CCBAU 21359]
MKQHLLASSIQLRVARVDAGRSGCRAAIRVTVRPTQIVSPAAGRPLISGCDDGLHVGVGEMMRHLDWGSLGGVVRTPWAMPNEVGSAAAT